MEMAKKRIVITPLIEFSETIGKDEIYNLLNSGAINALKILKQLKSKGNYEEIKSSIDDISDRWSPYEKFKSIMSSIADYEYRMVFLIDNFT